MLAFGVSQSMLHFLGDFRFRTISPVLIIAVLVTYECPMHRCIPSRNRSERGIRAALERKDRSDIEILNGL